MSETERKEPSFKEKRGVQKTRLEENIKLLTYQIQRFTVEHQKRAVEANKGRSVFIEPVLTNDENDAMDYLKTELAKAQAELDSINNNLESNDTLNPIIQ